MTPSKTLLITGASRGIGRACALALADAGFNLVLNYASNTAAAMLILASRILRDISITIPSNPPGEKPEQPHKATRLQRPL